MRNYARLACAVVLVIVNTSSAIAQGQTWTTKADAVPACRTEEILDRINRVRSDGDKEALVRLAMAAVLSGECIFLSRGETVYARVESLWSGTLKVRKRGEVAEYLAHSRLFEWDQLKKP